MIQSDKKEKEKEMRKAESVSEKALVISLRIYHFRMVC